MPTDGTDFTDYCGINFVDTAMLGIACKQFKQQVAPLGEAKASVGATDAFIPRRRLTAVLSALLSAASLLYSYTPEKSAASLLYSCYS